MKKLLVGSVAAAAMLSGAGMATASPTLEVPRNDTSTVRQYDRAHGPFNSSWQCTAMHFVMSNVATSGCYESGGKWWFNVAS